MLLLSFPLFYFRPILFRLHVHPLIAFGGIIIHSAESILMLVGKRNRPRLCKVWAECEVKLRCNRFLFICPKLQVLYPSFHLAEFCSIIPPATT